MVTAVFTAKCSLVGSTATQPVAPLRRGSRPNIRIGERYAICGVEPVGVAVLNPGETGEVLVTAMFDDADRDAIKEGTCFEFRSGPLILWATCRMLEIIEIRADSGT